MFKKILTIFLTLLATSIPMFGGDTTPVTLTPDNIEGGDGNVTNPGKGRRTPPAPVICLIDFEEGTISGDAPILATVIDYQLWDADGSACITASPIPAEVLTYAADSPGETFILRLVTPTVTLRAYISAD